MIDLESMVDLIKNVIFSLSGYHKYENNFWFNSPIFEQEETDFISWDIFKEIVFVLQNCAIVKNVKKLYFGSES